MDDNSNSETLIKTKEESNEENSFFIDEEKLIEEVITTPYERVIIILLRIKGFIADLNIPGNDMCKDLDWIIERISSHTLYTYELSQEYEELAKYKDEIPEIKNFLDFLTDYSETTRVSRSNNLKLSKTIQMGSSHSKELYDDVLQTPSTNMKRKTPSPICKNSDKINEIIKKSQSQLSEIKEITNTTMTSEQLNSSVASNKEETKEQDEKFRNTCPTLGSIKPKHTREKSLTLGSLRQMVDEGLLNSQEGPRVICDISSLPEKLPETVDRKDSPSKKTKYLISMNLLHSSDTSKEKPVQILPKSFQYDRKNILTKSFNIFEMEEAVGYSNVLPCVGRTLFDAFGVTDTMISINKLDALLNAISNGYNSKVPYHNAIHGADVTQTIGMYLFHSNIEEIAMTNINDIISLFSASLTHDIGHPGTNNTFQSNTYSDIALTYNDQSVLENYHSASFFFISRKPEFNIFDKFSDFDFKSLRKRIISLIIATDMVHHAKVLGVVKSRLQNLKTLSNDSVQKQSFISKESATIFDDQQKLLDFIIHLADLSHNSKLFKISQKWTELLMKEFWSQGDTEKALGLPPSFLCDRVSADVPKSQMGFIKGIIIPSFEVLVELTPSLKFLIDNMNNNLEEWAKITEEKRSGITPRYQKSPKLFPKMLSSPKLAPEKLKSNHLSLNTFPKTNKLLCPIVVPQAPYKEEPIITLVSFSQGLSNDNKDSHEKEENQDGNQKKVERTEEEDLRTTKRGKKQVLGLFGNEMIFK